MRIISGIYRNRNVYAPPGRSVRPTPERAREALFSILGVNLEGHVFLDLFAGAGTMGLEAVSRGADRSIFVEQDEKALRVLRQNIGKLGCDERCEILAIPVGAVGADVFSRATVVFLDPPYGVAPDIPRLGAFLVSAERPPLIIYQWDAIFRDPGSAGMRPGWIPDRMSLLDERKYGRTMLSLYATETE